MFRSTYEYHHGRRQRSARDGECRHLDFGTWYGYVAVLWHSLQNTLDVNLMLCCVQARNKSIDSWDQCTDWLSVCVQHAAWLLSPLTLWLTARKHLWFGKRYRFHKAIVGRETMITIQKRVFKMAGVKKLLEQNVENRDYMYKNDVWRSFKENY